MQANEDEKTPFWTFATAYFLVIASVMGTGILSLPVTTSLSGFFPFVVSYFIGLIFQSSVLLYLVELLQRNSAILRIAQAQVDSKPENAKPDESINRNNDDSFEDQNLSDDEDDNEVEDEETSLVGARNIQPVHGTDLHNLGKLFLGKAASVVFTLCVLVNLVSIITSYGIAGGESYAQLFNVDKKYTTSPFIIVFSLVLIFLAPILRGIISIFTFIKAVLLILMVFVTMIFALNFPQEIIDDWQFVTKPFLMGTVALGGALNIIPLSYAKVKYNRIGMRNLSLAVVLGLITVWTFSVFWTYFVLLSVPRQDLLNAYENGEIATVPLVDIMRTKDDSYSWIAYVVSIFIVISVSVSFLTMGTSLKHILDGFGETTINDCKHNKTNKFVNFLLKMETSCRNLVSSPYLIDTGVFSFLGASLYVIFFAIILAVALLNPAGFHLILERVTSLVLNIASLLILLMLISARSSPQTARVRSKLTGRKERVSVSAEAVTKTIPFQIPDFVFYPIACIGAGYFGFACVYDIAYWIAVEAR